MDDERLMASRRQQYLAETCGQVFMAFTEYMAQLEKKFNQIQYQTTNSELGMDLAYQALHELSYEMDNLEAALRIAKANKVALANEITSLPGHASR